MGVTGHGIVYGDEGDPPEFWSADQAQANSVEAALDAYETWNNWTPVFTSGGFSNLGSGGTSEGFYMRIGNLVHAEFRIELGTSPTVTSGIMAITLPVAGYGWSGDAFLAPLGSWAARDNDVTFHYAGSVAGSGSGGTGMVFPGAWSESSLRPRARVDENSPFAWAAGDMFSAVLNYRAA